MKSVALTSLSPLARQLAEESLAWMEPYGDESCHLLRYPGKLEHYGGLDGRSPTPHLVRESVWWAIGLLLRNSGSDAARAERILDAILPWQFNEPGQPYHGTFHRAPEEKLPPKQGAVMWQDYDPNWRQFIGTSFLVILKQLPDRLSPRMRKQLMDSIRLAVDGETPGRIIAAYSNIAMMHAVMLVHAGVLFHQAEWKERGAQLAREVFELFSEQKTFSEYNSPTYYGVILYGLRLWRLESSGPDLQAWGAEMETALWRHITNFYHPGLRNLCGPFDRAYGMDMTKYVAGIGVWMRLELEPSQAPVPLFKDDFHHRHDLTKAPLAALLGTDIPTDVKPHLKAFQKERTIIQVIESKPSRRTATACLKANRMWGAESGSTVIWDQFHPATAHWLQPDGTIAWMRLENKACVNATADAKGLKIEITNRAAPAHLIWHLSVNSPPKITRGRWLLPGMAVRVQTDLGSAALASGSAGLYTLTYEIAPQEKAFLDLKFLPEAI